MKANNIVAANATAPRYVSCAPSSGSGSPNASGTLVIRATGNWTAEIAARRSAFRDGARCFARIQTIRPINTIDTACVCAHIRCSSWRLMVSGTAASEQATITDQTLDGGGSATYAQTNQSPASSHGSAVIM